MNGRRIGWDHLGNAVPTGDCRIDALISEIQEVEDTGRYDAIPTTLHPWTTTITATEQLISGLVIREDGSILRRGGRLNLTWAAVALAGWDDPLTIGDVALILGVTTGTLHSYIGRDLPRGNHVPTPDMITGWSSNRPLRLWTKTTILGWMGKRPGKGYRTDRSTIDDTQANDADLDLIAHMNTTELITYLNRRSARTKYYPPTASLAWPDGETTEALDDGSQTLVVCNDDILRWDNLAWIQRRGRCVNPHQGTLYSFDACTTRGMERLDIYQRAVDPTAKPQTMIICGPCHEEAGHRI